MKTNENKIKTTEQGEVWRVLRDQEQRPDEVANDQEEPKQDERDQIKVYEDKIHFLVDDFNEREFAGKTQEELKNDKAYFPQLVNYLYINYLKGLLHTDTTKRSYRENKYNIEQLDNIFNIYRMLVYKYKWNSRPTIIEFSLLVGIHKETIYNWGAGINTNSLTTPEYSVTVKSWVAACEQALQDGNDTIKDIFLLKACHGYKDQDNTITVKHEVLPTIAAGDIPQVLGLPTSQERLT